MSNVDLLQWFAIVVLAAVALYNSVLLGLMSWAIQAINGWMKTATEIITTLRNRTGNEDKGRPPS